MVLSERRLSDLSINTFIGISLLSVCPWELAEVSLFTFVLLLFLVLSHTYFYSRFVQTRLFVLQTSTEE